MLLVISMKKSSYSRLCRLLTNIILWKFQVYSRCIKVECLLLKLLLCIHWLDIKWDLQRIFFTLIFNFLEIDDEILKYRMRKLKILEDKVGNIFHKHVGDVIIVLLNIIFPSKSHKLCLWVWWYGNVNTMLIYFF